MLLFGLEPSSVWSLSNSSSHSTAHALLVASIAFLIGFVVSKLAWLLAAVNCGLVVLPEIAVPTPQPQFTSASHAALADINDLSFLRPFAIWHFAESNFSYNLLLLSGRREERVVTKEVMLFFFRDHSSLQLRTDYGYSGSSVLVISARRRRGRLIYWQLDTSFFVHLHHQGFRFDVHKEHWQAMYVFRYFMPLFIQGYGMNNASLLIFLRNCEFVFGQPRTHDLGLAWRPLYPLRYGDTSNQLLKIRVHILTWFLCL